MRSIMQPITRSGLLLVSAAYGAVHRSAPGQPRGTNGTDDLRLEQPSHDADLHPRASRRRHNACDIHGRWVARRSGAMVEFDAWTAAGGTRIAAGAMGAMHNGQPIGMMGSGWHHGSDYGMMCLFTTR